MNSAMMGSYVARVMALQPDVSREACCMLRRRFFCTIRSAFTPVIGRPTLVPLELSAIWADEKGSMLPHSPFRQNRYHGARPQYGTGKKAAKP